MKLIKIIWENFGSYYGQHEFETRDLGLALIEGENQDELLMDSNGAGKSTIFDALDWCWFGTTRGLADEVVNDFAKDERDFQCVVTTILEDDDQTEIRIERGRKKNSNWLKVEKEGVDFSTLDARQTQAEIEKLLGLDSKTFHAAVLFAQSNITHYADATDAKRMEILTRVLQLDAIDQYLEKAKSVHGQIVERRDVLHFGINGIEKELEGLQQIDYQSLIDSWEKERQQRASATLMRLQEIENRRAELAFEISGSEDLTKQKAELETQLAGLQITTQANWVEQYQQAKNSLMQYHRLVGADEVDQKRLQAEIHRWQQKQEGICAECGQPVTAMHLQQALQQKQDDLQVVQNRMANTKRILNVWQERVTGFEAEYAKQQNAIVEQRKELEATLQKVNAAIFSVSAKQQSLDRLESDSKALQADVKNIEDQICPHLEQREKHKEKIEQLQNQIVKKREVLANIERALPYYAYWVGVFGKRGLKSYILDYRLQELTDAANQWVQLLTGGTFWIKFASQKKKAKGMVNAPDLRIYRLNAKGETIERSYRNWSGGEKQRISFAVDFGLSRFVAQRASKNLSFLGLDEAFRHLDRSGKTAVVGLLQRLAREKDTVLVVEHDQEFASQFDRRFRAVRKNDCSRLLEVGGEA